MDVVELCAGAGGQALGLERAGFDHALAVELDGSACQTLRDNRSSWKVAHGDVADAAVWRPTDYQGVDLLAGGVPCPPFSIAGRQLGAADERDLFAWAVEICAVVVRPRALLLENVRGLSEPRFGAYREFVLHRLAEHGYAGEWRLLHANDYGVPQLRPRFVLVAMKPADMAYFAWPAPTNPGPTVGKALVSLMQEGGWKHAAKWEALANDIAPTIVGGSKKHGGADLGPTRAKRAWRALGVNGLGIANAAPDRKFPTPDIETGILPKLTNRMVQRLQGWDESWGWEITGLKTAQYRQIGNAFPPPVAEAVGRQIHKALSHEGEPRNGGDIEMAIHDEVYRALRNAEAPLTLSDLLNRLGRALAPSDIELKLAHLARDFNMIETETRLGTAYSLGNFKAFTGQEMHGRHEYIAKFRTRVS